MIVKQRIANIFRWLADYIGSKEYYQIEEFYLQSLNEKYFNILSKILDPSSFNRVKDFPRLVGFSYCSGLPYLVFLVPVGISDFQREDVRRNILNLVYQFLGHKGFYSDILEDWKEFLSEPVQDCLMIRFATDEVEKRMIDYTLESEAVRNGNKIGI